MKLCVFLQCWEYGISLCRELAFQYETLYDYQSLSWIRVSKVCCSYQENTPLLGWKVTFSAPCVTAVLRCEVQTVSSNLSFHGNKTVAQMCFLHLHKGVTGL